MSVTGQSAPRLIAEWGRGLDEAEIAINALPYFLALIAWGFFLESLRGTERGAGRFYLVTLLHLAPVPLCLFCTRHEFWQFFRWGALGGVALIIGVPHFFWEPGDRMRPRILTAIFVVVAFGALLFVGLNKAA